MCSTKTKKKHGWQAPRTHKSFTILTTTSWSLTLPWASLTWRRRKYSTSIISRKSKLKRCNSMIWVGGQKCCRRARHSISSCQTASWCRTVYWVWCNNYKARPTTTSYKTSTQKTIIRSMAKHSCINSCTTPSCWKNCWMTTGSRIKCSSLQFSSSKKLGSRLLRKVYQWIDSPQDLLILR